MKELVRRLGIPAAALAVLVAVGGWMWGAIATGSGQVIGVVDGDRLFNEYLVEEVREPLSRAYAELEAQLRAEAEGQPEERQQALVNEYQARLDAIEDQMVQERLAIIEAAIAEIAQAEGLSIVLDRRAVYYGGVDVTNQVLAKLGIVVAD